MSLEDALTNSNINIEEDEAPNDMQAWMDAHNTQSSMVKMQHSFGDSPEKRYSSMLNAKNGLIDLDNC
jgi:hypothetical protein